MYVDGLLSTAWDMVGAQQMLFPVSPSCKAKVQTRGFNNSLLHLSLSPT